MFISDPTHLTRAGSTATTPTCQEEFLPAAVSGAPSFNSTLSQSRSLRRPLLANGQGPCQLAGARGRGCGAAIARDDRGASRPAAARPGRRTTTGVADRSTRAVRQRPGRANGADLASGTCRRSRVRGLDFGAVAVATVREEERRRRSTCNELHSHRVEHHRIQMFF